jgi:transcriptional regulator with XRE-family HTH domain
MFHEYQRMNEKQFYKELGEMVAARRRQQGLKQAQVAQQAGMSRAALANIEVGRQRVLAHQICRLAATLKLDDPSGLLPKIRNSEAEALPMSDTMLTKEQKSQIERLIDSVQTAQPKMAKT